MVWVGVILFKVLPAWKGHPPLKLYCFEWDTKRGNWELPKGGAELTKPRFSTGCVDSSPFATARAELWEETNIWLGWRDWGSFHWLDAKGEVLWDGFLGNENGRLYTEIEKKDNTGIADSRVQWLSLEEYRKVPERRNDHVDLLECVEASRDLQAM